MANWMRKSPIECRAGGRTGREEGAQESGEAGTDVRGRDMGIEESARKEIGCYGGCAGTQRQLWEEDTPVGQLRWHRRQQKHGETIYLVRACDLERRRTLAENMVI